MSEVQENALHRRGVRGLEESERLEDFEMRESLFRGKRADNGEWIEGFLVKKFDKWYIYDFDFLPYSSEITPETAGQYTGLTDKNGKKIFEGDIVRITTTVKTDWIKDENGNYKELKRTDCAIVQHDKNTGGYKLKVYNKGIYKRIAKFDLVHIGYYYGAEVIGNIHDNPELLQGDK